METFMRNNSSSTGARVRVRSSYTADRSTRSGSALPTGPMIVIDIDNGSRIINQSAQTSPEAVPETKSVLSTAANLSVRAILSMKAKVASKLRTARSLSSPSTPVAAPVIDREPHAGSLASESQSSKTAEKVGPASVHAPTAFNQSKDTSEASSLTIIPEVDDIEEINIKDLYEKELRAQAEYKARAQAELEKIRRAMKEYKR